MNQYDVAIIGSGIAGSALASILARHGKRVIVLEAGSHPRFAIGESMILETSEVMRTLAELYSVPELAYFSSENYFGHIGTQHGVKRHFSYLHHSSAQTHDLAKTLQAVIPKQPHGHELHLYRQDVDAFLANTAVSYGATLLQSTPVTQVEFSDDGVTIAAGGQTYQAEYVVDGAGFRSPLAEKFGLRTFDLKTHSRAIFTHVIDLKCVHETGPTRQDYALPFKLSEGTLHHVFEGGWLWVIPFNNYQASTNPLASVGLMLDPRVHPKRDELSAEDEFFDFINHFPTIAAQFESAKAVRPWTRTGRIQYASKQIVGDRWALLGHAAGFVDPLYSKGLYSSFTAVSVLAHLLLSAEGDYSREIFMPLEHKTLAFLRANDRLVANSYKSFSDHKLWQAYSVLWLLGAYTELVKLMSARARSKTRAEYYADTACLELAGGGFENFIELAGQIDGRLERLDLKDAAEVAQWQKQTRTLLHQTDWTPQAFRDVLTGKNHLPRRKLRLGLLKKGGGFLGRGSYRTHFFGRAAAPELVRSFLGERLRYSSLNLRRRARKRRMDAL